MLHPEPHSLLQEELSLHNLVKSPYTLNLYRYCHVTVSKSFDYWHIGDLRMHNTTRISFCFKLGFRYKYRYYGIRFREHHKGLALEFTWL
jgi:hypothetical protein